MRVALFVTCFNDTMFPDTGGPPCELLERLGVEVDFPRPRPAAGRCTSTPATAPRRAAGAPVRRDLRRLRRGGHPVGVVRRAIVHHHATIAAERGDAALRAGVARVAPRVYELSEFLLDVLGK